MTIFLTGFMGSGKSTVGRLLARRLDRPFVDLDNEIERLEGRTIAAIFEESGEESFRAAERKALAALALDSGPVVATGGGIVLEPENRRLMSRAGLRIWFKCPLAVLIGRLEAAGGRRPLWTGDRQALGRLLEQRTGAYAEADLVVDATAEIGVTVETIVSWLGGRENW